MPYRGHRSRLTAGTNPLLDEASRKIDRSTGRTGSYYNKGLDQRIYSSVTAGLGWISISATVRLARVRDGSISYSLRGTYPD